MRHGELKIVVMRGCEDFADKIIKNLRTIDPTEYGDLIVKSKCTRFDTGEAKGLIEESVRGKDLFIITDPFNYSVTYKMRGVERPMSPDEHYQDVKRIIAAVAGKASRISVIMPMLYEGRQHKKTHRESLDCALMLMELTQMGVENIVTFDAHDPRVVNAIPLIGFDNFHPTYQMTKALNREFPDVRFDKDHLIIVSPDEGGMSRCIEYSKVMDLDLSMFYKRRDLDASNDGSAQVLEHRYLGAPLHGKDAIVIDDMVSTGGSLIKVCKRLKEEGAERVFAFITFGLFCKGYEMFSEAYEKGQFDKLFITNLTYIPEEIAAQDWVSVVDMSKYTAYIIHALNRDESVGKYISPEAKISALIERKKAEIN